MAAFGGVDILVNTAAVYPSVVDGMVPDAAWANTLNVNVTANYLMATEVAKIFEEQGLHGNIVLTSSGNAVIPQKGSEAYDVSKAALSHLVRELAVILCTQCARRTRSVRPTMSEGIQPCFRATSCGLR